MTPVPMNLATEDEVSEIVLKRLLASSDRYAVGYAYRQGGFGYLRRTIGGWNTAAKGIPFVVLTDLDATACPVRLIDDWLPNGKHPNLLFRIAVREVESWLLADPENLSDFLGISRRLISLTPDEVPDPKAAIINLARKSRSRIIREGIVPRRGSTAQIGPDYNGCLGRFVGERWDIEVATSNSTSLARTVSRLNSFDPVW